MESLKIDKEFEMLIPALRSNLKEINKSIDNIIKAIEDGIYTSSTKKRLQELEKSRDETELLIAKEEIKKPLLSKEDVVSWFCELRKLNIESLSARKCLIDIFKKIRTFQIEEFGFFLISDNI